VINTILTEDFKMFLYKIQVYWSLMECTKDVKIFVVYFCNVYKDILLFSTYGLLMGLIFTFMVKLTSRICEYEQQAPGH
jgi:hypothetical protein